MSKLEVLAEIEGVDVIELLEGAAFDSVCPGICMSPDCDYTTEVEPDCHDGYCEACEKQSVKSALVLANMI
jgi:hypothetical protein